MPEAQYLQHKIDSGYIQIVANNTHIPAFWAHPSRGGPFPGLVLLHDDRGLNAHSRSLANRFAEVGYYVVVPDLYERHLPSNPQEAQAMENYYLPIAPTKVDAAIAALESHHKCNNKLAVIGWDMGGSLVFDTVMRRKDIMAAITFYGNPVPYFGRFEQVRSPILALFGQHDEIMREHENKLRSELLRTSRPHEVIVYPDAQHGFFNDTLGDIYDPLSSEDAWNQSLIFLETYQGKPPTPGDAQSGAFRPGNIY